MGLMLNHQPVKTTDACDLGAGAFYSNSYDFTATVNPFNLHFDFVAGEYPDTMKIDNGVYLIFPVGNLKKNPPLSLSTLRRTCLTGFLEK